MKLITFTFSQYMQDFADNQYNNRRKYTIMYSLKVSIDVIPLK